VNNVAKQNDAKESVDELKAVFSAMSDEQLCGLAEIMSRDKDKDVSGFGKKLFELLEKNS